MKDLFISPLHKNPGGLWANHAEMEASEETKEAGDAMQRRKQRRILLLGQDSTGV